MGIGILHQPKFLYDKERKNMKLLKHWKPLLSSAILCGFTASTLAASKTSTAYQDWKQSDSPWGSKKIGDTGTMAAWGCKITSIAILMVHSGVKKESNFNPGTLLDYFDKKGLITHSSLSEYDGNLHDNAISKANSPNFYYAGSNNYLRSSFSSIYSDINKLLKQGYFVEVRVKNNNHSVAVNYCSNGEVYIMDPGYNVNTLRHYDGGIFCCNYYKAVKSNDDMTPVNYNFPTHIRQGKAFSISGVIKSTVSNISSLTVGIYTETNTAKCTKTVRPNTKSFDLSKINSYILFNKLSIGTYYYRVTATNKTKTKKVINRKFTVLPSPNPPDDLSITAYNYPTELKKGQAYSIRGSIKSVVSNIKMVTVCVCNTNETYKTEKTVNPNRKIYSLTSIAPYICFDKLSPGDYYYKITVANSSKNEVIVNVKFKIS